MKLFEVTQEELDKYSSLDGLCRLFYSKTNAISVEMAQRRLNQKEPLIDSQIFGFSNCKFFYLFESLAFSLSEVDDYGFFEECTTHSIIDTLIQNTDYIPDNFIKKWDEIAKEKKQSDQLKAEQKERKLYEELRQKYGDS
jgi:hypothetical protein